MAKDEFMPSRPRGLAYALASGLVLATGPLLVRLVEGADSWQIATYRSGSLGVALFVLLALRYGRRTLSAYCAIGWQGLFGAVCLSFGYGGYVVAMRETTVANAAFILAAFPVATALAAWTVLGEKVRKETWIAIIGTAAGIAIMVHDGLAAGHLQGNAAALVAMLAITIYMVVVRRRRDIDMLPALSLGGLLAGVEAAVIADSLVIPTRDLAICLGMGGVQVLLGFGLYTLAARHAPVAEVALLGLGEMVFGPVLAWAVLGEVPGIMTLGGGIIVLTSVVLFTLAGMRRERAQATVRPVRPPAPAPAVGSVMPPAALRSERQEAMTAALSLASVRSEEPVNAVAARPRRKGRRLPPETFEAPSPAATEGPTIESTLRLLMEPVLREWVARNTGIVTERLVRPEVRALIEAGLARRTRRP